MSLERVFYDRKEVWFLVLTLPLNEHLCLETICEDMTKLRGLWTLCGWIDWTVAHFPKPHLYFCHKSFQCPWAKSLVVPYFHVPLGTLPSFFLLSTIYNPIIRHTGQLCLLIAHSLFNYQSILYLWDLITLKMGVSHFWGKYAHDQPPKVPLPLSTIPLGTESQHVNLCRTNHS